MIDLVSGRGKPGACGASSNLHYLQVHSVVDSTATFRIATFRTDLSSSYIARLFSSFFLPWMQRSTQSTPGCNRLWLQNFVFSLSFLLNPQQTTRRPEDLVWPYIASPTPHVNFGREDAPSNAGDVYQTLGLSP